MILTLLQGALSGGEPPSCGSQPAFDLLVEGWFRQGWVCAMTGGNQSSLLLLSTMLVGGVGLSLFIATGSLTIPAVLAILVGGVLLAALPATFINVTLIMLLLIIPAGGVLFFKTYLRR